MREVDSITIQGFKSVFEPQKIKIKPLTVISGSNSAGKSSFMQAILLLKQSIESTYDSGEIKINGDNVKFNDISKMLSKIDSQQAKTFNVAFDIAEYNKPPQGFKPTKKLIYNISCKYGKQKNLGLTIQSVEVDDFSGRKPASLGLKTLKISERTLSRLKSINALGSFYNLMSRKKAEAPSFTWYSVPRKCFLNVEMNLGDEIVPSGINLCSVINDFCAGIIHLPGLRGNPERTYEKITMFEAFPGRFEKYTASVIFNWVNTGNQKNLKKLATYVSLLGLGGKIEVRDIDDANLEICVSKKPPSISPKGNLTKNEDDDSLVSIADVGFGVSQALPILVALIVAERGQTIYIEQPEIHLHPRAQANLIAPLIEASNRGVKIIIETHSSILLRAIQTAVASDDVLPDNISLNWFSRDERGCTIVTQDEVDEYGAFGNWPVDFDEVYLNSEDQYLEAVERKYEKNR